MLPSPIPRRERDETRETRERRERELKLTLTLPVTCGAVRQGGHNSGDNQEIRILKALQKFLGKSLT